MPETNRVLQKLASKAFLADFTFVGGSALAHYLSHRYSEDIDLFTWQKTLNSLDFQHQLEKAGFSYIKALNLSVKEADFLLDHVRVTFFAHDWEEFKNRKSIENNLYIADLPMLAVMKVNYTFFKSNFQGLL